MIVVTAAIIINDDRVLITRRACGKHLAGYWEFPGGKLDIGETEEECLAREIKEELDVDVEIVRFFMENKHQYNDKNIFLKAYVCKHLRGKIILKDHDKKAWVTIGELGSYKFSPADIPFIDKLRTDNY